MSESTRQLEAFLNRFLAGDADAKNALLTQALNRLQAIARTRLQRFPALRAKEESTAVVNEAYRKMSKALDDVRPATLDKFFGLMALQIQRVLMDWARGGNGVVNAIGPASASSGVSRVGHREDVLEALDTLPADQRMVVDLLFFGGLTQGEAAEILGVHEATVKRGWARARLHLAEVLAAYGQSR